MTTFQLTFHRRDALGIFESMCDGMEEVHRDNAGTEGSDYDAEEATIADNIAAVSKAVRDADDSVLPVAITLDAALRDAAEDVLANCEDNNDAYYKPYVADPADPDYDQDSAESYLFSGDVEISSTQE